MLTYRTLFAPEQPLDFLSGGGITLEEDDHSQDDQAKKEAAEKARKEKEAADAAAAEKDKDKNKNKGRATEEQVGIIRKERDALLKENEELKKTKDELEKLKGLKPIAEYVEKRFGKLDDDAVNKFIEKNKERKTKLLDTEKKYAEKEQVVRDLEITKSDLWANDYAIPLRKADEGLLASIAMVDKDGNIRYPEQFLKLKQVLLTVDKEGKPKNAIQVKQALKEFATEFKNATQEEYEIPKLTDVTVAVEDTFDKYKKALDAKQNWEKTLEEKNKEKLYDSTKKQERDTETIILQRTKALEVAKDQFKYDTVDGLFKEEEVKEEFDKNHDYIVKIMRGKEKQIEYNIYIEKMTKANLFDGLVEKYKELEKQYQKDIGKKHASLSSRSADRSGSSDNKPPVNKDEQPLDFLH